MAISKQIKKDFLQCLYTFIYLFLSELSLCFCLGFSLVVVNGDSSSCVPELLIVVASPVTKHSLYRVRASVVVAQ